MSALPEALPLALTAAFNPPAILIVILLLRAEHPHRLVFAFLAGAATVIATIGFGGLFLLRGSGATHEANRSLSASVDFVLGAILILLAAWAWGKHRRPVDAVGEDASSGGPAGRLSERATSSVRWSFALGFLIFLGSAAYLAAVKVIADSDGSTASQVAAVIICGVVVLLCVEVPALVLLIRPDGLRAALERLAHWFAANSWAIVATLAGLAGAWMILNAAMDVG